jgi:hypothetical protein
MTGYSKQIKGILDRPIPDNDEQEQALIDDLTNLISNACNEARIDELKWVKERLTLFHSVHNSFEDNQRLTKKINDDRIQSLKENK